VAELATDARVVGLTRPDKPKVGLQICVHWSAATNTRARVLGAERVLISARSGRAPRRITGPPAAHKETDMSRLGQSWLALSFVAFAASPAGAQVTIDVSKITCEQYILYTVANPHDIAVWLSGYYNGKRNNTVITRRNSASMP
jgi:HdeA/HdeB family